MASNEPRWHPDAIKDAETARNWYAERSPFAARGFLLALDAAVDAVVEAPHVGRNGRMDAVSISSRHATLSRSSTGSHRGLRSSQSPIIAASRSSGRGVSWQP